QNSELIKNLRMLLLAHRGAFGQERIFMRMIGGVIGEIMTFGRHTLTQVLVALGLGADPWSAWYRLFSRNRFDEEAVTKQLFRETLQHVAADEVYVVGGDVTEIARDSHKMEGSCWLKCPRNPPFMRSIHRAQRFLHGAWLMPPEQGYSRALPLRMIPAFTEKAKRRRHEAVKEWAAGRSYMQWVREQLDEAGRAEQQVLGLFDGSYDTLDWWKTLPDRVFTLVRTAKNRDLRELYTGTDRRRKYGPKALKPGEWLHVKEGWTTLYLTIRRRKRRMVYRVEGPYIRYGAADTV
ncbi:transposase, partial [Chloroflexota bacterium]